MRTLALLNNRYPALHGLRGVAVVFVVQIHVTFVSVFSGIPVPAGWHKYSYSAWFGMDMFFVLSGFLIGHMILYSLDSSNRVGMLRFYARRAFRIFPLYYVCLILISLLPQDGQFPSHDGIGWREWVYLTNYSFSFGNVMYWSWSLSVEEHFYLLVPMILILLHRLRTHVQRLALLGTLWGACLLIKLSITLSMLDQLNVISFLENIYAPTHTRFDTMVAGIAAAYVHRAWGAELDRVFAKPLANGVVLGSLAVLIAVIMTQFSLVHLSDRPRTYFLVGSLLVGTPTSIVFAGLILWVIHSRGALTGILGHRYFHYYATLGYGIYIVHIPVIDQLVLPYILLPVSEATRSFAAAWCAGLLACITLSAAVAFLLHLAVERPALWLRDRMAP